MLMSLTLVASLFGQANAEPVMFTDLATAATACVYRCDQDWEGLDRGRCYEGDGCPSPDSQEVANDVCADSMFQPGPGDILQHEVVPFFTSSACEHYLSSWGSNQRQLRVAPPPTPSPDLTSFEDRGKVFKKTTKTILTHCARVHECQDIILSGPTGKDIEDCVNRCALEVGEGELERVLCDATAEFVTGGAASGIADFFCNNVLSVILHPFNKFLNEHIEEPIIDALDYIEGTVVHKVEEAAHAVSQRVHSFLHFLNPFGVVV